MTRTPLLLAALLPLALCAIGCGPSPFLPLDVNHAPVSTAVQVSTIAGFPVQVLLAAVDADLDSLTWVVETQPLHGTLQGLAPVLGYTPATGFVGTDGFSFHASDRSVDGTTAQVTIVVAEDGPGNDPPVAAAQTVLTQQDTSVQITLGGADPEGHALTWRVVTQPVHGTLTGSAPVLTYLPALGYVGGDSFTFSVDDGATESAPATVSITVSAPAQWTEVDLGFALAEFATIAVGEGRGDGTVRVYAGEGGFYGGAVHELTYGSGSWSDLAVGSDVSDVKGFAVADLRNDGVSGVYAVGYDFAEYRYLTGAWGGGLVGPSLQWVNGLAVGRARNDGVLRAYIPSWDGVLERSYAFGDWTTVTIGASGISVECLVVADARNDGSERVYALMDRTVYEFSWSGSSWTVAECGAPDVVALGVWESVCAGDGRNDGRTRIYLCTTGLGGSQGLWELSYEQGAWRYVTIGDSVEPFALLLSDARGAGTVRLYTGTADSIGEYTYAGSWGKTSVISTSYAVNALAAGNGRNDGITRLYAAGANKHLYEYSAP